MIPPLNASMVATIALVLLPHGAGAQQPEERLTFDYYIEQNDAFGSEWIVGFNMAPVVENVLTGIFDR